MQCSAADRLPPPAPLIRRKCTHHIWRLARTDLRILLQPKLPTLLALRHNKHTSS